MVGCHGLRSSVRSAELGVYASSVLEAVLDIGRAEGFDTIRPSYREKNTNTDILFDIPKLARYVSSIDTRYRYGCFEGHRLQEERALRN